MPLLAGSQFARLVELESVRQRAWLVGAIGAACALWLIARERYLAPRAKRATAEAAAAAGGGSATRGNTTADDGDAPQPPNPGADEEQRPPARDGGAAAAWRGERGRIGLLWLLLMTTYCATGVLGLVALGAVLLLKVVVELSSDPNAPHLACAVFVFVAHCAVALSIAAVDGNTLGALWPSTLDSRMRVAFTLALIAVVGAAALALRRCGCVGEEALPLWLADVIAYCVVVPFGLATTLCLPASPANARVAVVIALLVGFLSLAVGIAWAARHTHSAMLCCALPLLLLIPGHAAAGGSQFLAWLPTFV